jgi:transcriptional regulator with XRE-family HTH domain
MNVKDLLFNTGVSQQQLADFTGIPKERIKKWAQNDQAPPKAADLKIIERSGKFLSTLGKNASKEIHKYIIVGDAVEVRPEYKSDGGDTLNEAGTGYDSNSSKKKTKDTGRDSFITADDLREFMHTLRLSQENMERLTIGINKLIDTNSTLANKIASV